MTIAREHSHDSGFTFIEVVLVLAIVGILTAVAFPLYMNGRVAAINQSTSGTLTAVGQAINTRLGIWQGTPPAAFAICHMSTTYPTTPMPPTVCDPGRWRAVNAPSGSPLRPALEGSTPDNVTITGYVDRTGAYCLDASSTSPNTDTYYLTNTITEPETGTCLGIGWAARNTGNPLDTITRPAPPPPLGLDYTRTENQVTLTWACTKNTGYLASITGQATPAIVLPANDGTCQQTFSNVPTGTYLATVRARDNQAWGPPATTRVGVP